MPVVTNINSRSKKVSIPAEILEEPVVGDDAKAVHVFRDIKNLPPMAFDHGTIIQDFIRSDYPHFYWPFDLD